MTIISRKQCIVIITNGFPYGESERSFFSKEYEELQKNNNIILISLNPDSENIKYPTSESELTIRLETNSITPIKRLKSLLNPKVIKEVLFEANIKRKKVYKCMLSTTLDYSKSEIVTSCINAIDKDYEIQLVYTYWCTYATYAAIQYKHKRPNVMVISRFHGYDLYSERSSHGFFPFRNLVLDNLDYLIFACNAGKKYISNSYGNRYELKSIVSYIGAKEIENYDYSPKGNEICVLSCSNIINIKRIDKIIDALALIDCSYHIKWIHIGDGPLKNDIENYALLRLGKKSNIIYRFTGFIENNKLSEIIIEEKPTVFITTSSSEGGAPVTIQEMFSAHIPAIGTNVGGIPELIIDGYSGILLDEDAGIHEISKAIIRFMCMPQKEKERMSRNAYDLWKKFFNVDINAAAFSKWIEGMLQERR